MRSATSVSVGGVSVPEHFDQAELQSWLLQHPRQAANLVPLGPGPAPDAAQIRSAIDQNIATLYGDYVSNEVGGSNPAANERPRSGYGSRSRSGLGSWSGSVSARSPGSER